MRIQANRAAGNTSPDADRVDQKQVQQVQKRDNAGDVKTPNRADTAVLSHQARDVLIAQKALSDVPRVRQDRIAELRQQIADGVFEVNSELIADRILRGVV